MSRGPGAPTQQPVDSAAADHPTRLLEVAGVFTKLGFTAFGGPAAHLALIEDQVVTRRRWLDRRQFLDMAAAINFIPGPNSTELVIHLGLLRAGWAGLFVAGACFIAPAMLIILPIAWAYTTYGTLPAVGGAMTLISCVIVAIVAMAALRFIRASVTDAFTTIVALAAAGIAVALARHPRFQPELTALAGAAIAGIVRAAWTKPASNTTLPCIALPPLAEMALVPLAMPPLALKLAQMSGTFLKIGATLFGSGYVLISYLRSSFVAQRHWLTEQQLLDAIAVGQFTPGPLLTSATFAGYVMGHTTFAGGHAGGAAAAVAATIAIFLPSFVLVAMVGPALGRIRNHPLARGALDAMNAAVAALLVVVTVQIGMAALTSGGWIGAIVAALASLALWRGANATWLIVVAGIVGFLWR
jgi:chromate transporter